MLSIGINYSSMRPWNSVKSIDEIDGISSCVWDFTLLPIVAPSPLPLITLYEIHTFSFRFHFTSVHFATFDTESKAHSLSDIAMTQQTFYLNFIR